MNDRGARLPVVTEDAASGETAQMYDVIRAHFGLGFVPEVFQLLGTRPEYLRALWETYLSVFDVGVLPRDVKELIAAFVANEAGCQYCAGAHSLLAQMTCIFNAVVRLVDTFGLSAVGQFSSGAPGARA